MYHHVPKSFENSLRGGSDFSITNLKNKHKTCKGTLHAAGNYQKVATAPQNKIKSSSVSSEGFSESDSVDSLKDEANRKNSAICDRLHNASTKASIAKTAKMRYLEDADEDTVWIEDLPKSTKREPAAAQKKASESPNNFVRASAARNSFTSSRGSFRKTTPTNGIKNSTITNGVKSSTPPTPVVNGIRNNLLRSSGRRSVRKKWKGGLLSWEEAWFRANNKKVHWLNSDDKTNCFKDLNSLMARTDEKVQVRHFWKIKELVQIRPSHSGNVLLVSNSFYFSQPVDLTLKPCLVSSPH